jgi:hypothetical protein
MAPPIADVIASDSSPTSWTCYGKWPRLPARKEGMDYTHRSHDEHLTLEEAAQAHRLRRRVRPSIRRRTPKRSQ